MPQMAPLIWLNIFFFIITSTFISSSILYFTVGKKSILTSIKPMTMFLLKW